LITAFKTVEDGLKALNAYTRFNAARIFFNARIDVQYFMFGLQSLIWMFD
jgi:hypothetical protein